MNHPVWWDEETAVAVDHTSAPLIQEVVRYAVKQYFYKIGKITYLKIVTCIIEMMYY
jgi:hypothetical protein